MPPDDDRAAPSFSHHRHLVALAAVEADDLGGVLHRHHAHAVGAGVGLDHHKGLVGDAVFCDLARMRVSSEST